MVAPLKLDRHPAQKLSDYRVSAAFTIATHGKKRRSDCGRCRESPNRGRRTNFENEQGWTQLKESPEKPGRFNTAQDLSSGRFQLFEGAKLGLDDVTFPSTTESEEPEREFRYLERFEVFAPSGFRERDRESVVLRHGAQVVLHLRGNLGVGLAGHRSCALSNLCGEVDERCHDGDRSQELPDRSQLDDGHGFPS